MGRVTDALIEELIAANRCLYCGDAPPDCCGHCPGALIALRNAARAEREERPADPADSGPAGGGGGRGPKLWRAEAS